MKRNVSAAHGSNCYCSVFRQRRSMSFIRVRDSGCLMAHQEAWFQVLGNPRDCTARLLDGLLGRSHFADTDSIGGRRLALTSLMQNVRRSRETCISQLCQLLAAAFFHCGSSRCSPAPAVLTSRRRLGLGMCRNTSEGLVTPWYFFLLQGQWNNRTGPMEVCTWDKTQGLFGYFIRRLQIGYRQSDG